MGKLIVQQFVSADGFAASSHNTFDAVGDEIGHTPEFDLDLIERLKPVSGIVLGRATYDMFAAYWPTSASDDQLVAPTLNDLPKHVFSNTIGEAPWGDFGCAEVHAGDAIENVRRLKAELPGDLILWGSLTLANTLFEAGEVDEVRLGVVPVALGSGRTVFPEGFGHTRFELISVEQFDQGIVALEYGVLPR